MRIWSYSLAGFALVAVFAASTMGQEGVCPSSPVSTISWPVSQNLTASSELESNQQWIIGTLGELRRAAAALPNHLHGGVDVKPCPPGAKCASQNVFAVAGGEVGPINVISKHNKTVNVGNFMYTHLDTVDPFIVQHQGQAVVAGTLIGTYSASIWNHVHIEQYDNPRSLLPGASAPTQRCNPLLSLMNYQDTIAPQAPSNIVPTNFGSSTPLQTDSLGGFVIDRTQSRLSVFATSFDKLGSGPQLGSQQAGLYGIGYCAQLASVSGNCSPVMFKTLFDHSDFISSVFLVYDTASPDDFRYEITNSPDSLDFLDTSSWQPGRYILSVFAEDTTTFFQAPNSAMSSIGLVKPAVLKVTENDTGTGTVTASPTPLLPCPSTATAQCGEYGFDANDQGTTVTLTASPASGSTFVGWIGDCTGTNLATTLVMSSDKTCAATFTSSQINWTTTDARCIAGSITEGFGGGGHAWQMSIEVDVKGTASAPVGTYFGGATGFTASLPAGWFGDGGSNQFSCASWNNVFPNLECLETSASSANTAWTAIEVQTFVTQKVAPSVPLPPPPPRITTVTASAVAAFGPNAAVDPLLANFSSSFQLSCQAQ